MTIAFSLPDKDVLIASPENKKPFNEQTPHASHNESAGRSKRLVDSPDDPSAFTGLEDSIRPASRDIKPYVDTGNDGIPAPSSETKQLEAALQLVANSHPSSINSSHLGGRGPVKQRSLTAMNEPIQAAGIGQPQTEQLLKQNEERTTEITKLNHTFINEAQYGLGKIVVTEGSVDNNEVPPGVQKARSEDQDIILDVMKRPESKELKAEDKEAQMISYCYRDRQCSGHAFCVRKNLKNPGFCRCLADYRGNGVFCWEDINIRSDIPYGESTDSKTRTKKSNVRTEHQYSWRNSTFS